MRSFMRRPPRGIVPVRAVLGLALPVSRLPVLALLGLLPLAGCGSSEPDYYTLKPWPGTAQGGGPLSLKLRTPAVASSLDRDYIVRSDPGYKLTLAHDAAWSEPLGDMIGQTLAQDLQQRLPGTTVFTEAGAISTEAQAVLELDIGQFAQDAAGNVGITATLSVTRPDGAPGGSHALHLVVAPSGPNVDALVAGLSQLLGEVADQAARDARLLGPAPAALLAPEPPAT